MLIGMSFVRTSGFGQFSVSQEGGGVLIAIQSNLISERLIIAGIDGVEMISVKLCVDFFFYIAVAV